MSSETLKQSIRNIWKAVGGPGKDSVLYVANVALTGELDTGAKLDPFLVELLSEVRTEPTMHDKWIASRKETEALRAEVDQLKRVIRLWRS